MQKIFVVDDVKPIAELLSELLREDHFDVETFYDARSVLKRAKDCVPDVLVSDIGMPEMNGIELAKAVRERSQNCKVILISGNPEWKASGDWQSAAPDDFALLRKPFPMSQLLRLVESVTELDRRA